MATIHPALNTLPASGLQPAALQADTFAMSVRDALSSGESHRCGRMEEAGQGRRPTVLSGTPVSRAIIRATRGSQYCPWQCPMPARHRLRTACVEDTGKLRWMLSTISASVTFSHLQMTCQRGKGDRGRKW